MGADYLYAYNVELTPGSALHASGGSLNSANFFTLYDIPGLVPGSAESLSKLLPGFNLSEQFVGITPFTETPKPPDSPSLLNITATYTGADFRPSQTPPFDPVSLGTLSFLSKYPLGPTQLAYTAATQKLEDFPSLVANNTGQVAGPGPWPGISRPPGSFHEFPVPTPFSSPTGITAGPAIDPYSLWFVEQGGNNIGRLGAGGGFREFPIPTPDSQPLLITAGKDNSLWFVEQGATQIGRLTVSGRFTEYSIPTPYSVPMSITLGPYTDPDTVWFTEFAGNNIVRLSSTGDFTEFPIPTFGSGPAGITAGPDGAIWFTEFQANQIGQLTTDGKFSEFSIPTPYSGPQNITVGSDGNLWFTEMNGNQIGRITTDGTITEFSINTPDSGPHFITAANDGNVYFTEVNANQIGCMSPAGTITEFPIPTTDSGPTDITSGADGNIWFTEKYANKIGQFAIKQGGPAASFQVNLPTNITAGMPFSVIVTALDARGRVTTGYTGTVTFSSSDSYPGVSPAEYTFVPGDSGTHTFTGLTLFTAGAQTVTVRDKNADSISDSTTAMVIPAPANHFVLLAPPMVASGSPFGVVVSALDPYGNVDTSYAGTVRFTTSDGDPAVVLPATYTFSSTDGGSHFFAQGVTLITPGDQTLRATDTRSGITGSATITVAPTPAPPGVGGGRKHTRFGSAFITEGGAVPSMYPLETGEREAWSVLAMSEHEAAHLFGSNGDPVL
jgi:streptogramin lyase